MYIEAQPLLNRIPTPIRRAGIFAITGVALLAAACGGSKAEGQDQGGNNGGGNRITVETPVPTFTPTQEVFKPVHPEAAKPSIITQFAPTTYETAKSSLDLAIQKHPSVLDLKAHVNGLKMTKEQLNSVLESCRQEKMDQLNCGGLVRSLYLYYYQTGFEEYYTAAKDAFNLFRTSNPDRMEGFMAVINGEFNLHQLPLR